MPAAYGYGAQRTHGAEILAGAAANAEVFVHYRPMGLIFSGTHHLNCGDGTVAGAIAAADAILCHTKLAIDPGKAYMVTGLLFAGYLADGPGGADLAAAGALGPAVAAFIRHLRLHQMLQ